jgi:ubiquinone/menaquinone biosynthesis C-methylase UbiE
MVERADVQSRMSSIDQRNYDNPAMVQQYVTTTLRPAEIMMFMKYRDEIAGRRVMDMGCGAGRVTSYLSRWTPHVVGIDFARAMIDYCTRTFPNVRFVHCDARDLKAFEDGSFDVALFTFNGIDTLSHESRLQALAGVHRILAENGLFIFSSHNRRSRYARPEPRVQFTRNPVTLAMRTVEFGRSVANRIKTKRLERDEAEYALINDNAHQFSMLHYYIDRDTQAKQLACVGCELLEAYGEDGAVHQPGDDDSATSEMYYLARRI